MSWKRQTAILTLAFFIGALCAPILHADPAPITAKWVPFQLSNGSYVLNKVTPGGILLPGTIQVPSANGVPATLFQAQAAAAKMGPVTINPTTAAPVKVTPTSAAPFKITPEMATTATKAKWLVMKDKGGYHLQPHDGKHLIKGSIKVPGTNGAKPTMAQAQAAASAANAANAPWIVVKHKGGHHLQRHNGTSFVKGSMKVPGANGTGSTLAQAQAAAKAANGGGATTVKGGGATTGKSGWFRGLKGKLPKGPKLGKTGTAVKGAAKAGLGMAAISAVVTVGADMIDQSKRNDGLIDINQSLGTLGTRQFLGGTGGAIVGATALSTVAQFIPGPIGVVAKPLLAFTGAAIGSEAGSGNWKDADWVKIGAQTVGSTAGWMGGLAVGTAVAAKLGAVLGTALIPIPGVGTAIGIACGIAGSIIAGKIVDWLRKKNSDDPYTDEEEIMDAERMTGTNVQYGEWDWNSNPSGRDTLFDQTYDG